MTPLARVSRWVGEPLKAPVKHAYGRWVSRTSARFHADYDPARTVVVLGSPRSGTTWLMNILCQLPGSAPIFEPLNRRQDRRLAAILADEFPRLAPDASLPALAELLREVYAGRHLTRWSSAYATLPSLLRADRFVVKLIRAMRAAGWLCAQFPKNRVVLVIRHPCAVVDSLRRSLGIWNDWSREQITREVARTLGPAAGAVLSRLASRDELLAAWWCAEQLAALRETPRRQVLAVSYEELVRRPEELLPRVFAHLGETLPPEALAEARRASETANPEAAIRRGTDPLESWRRRLSHHEIAAILGVTQALGIRFYDDAPMPDLVALAALPRAPEHNEWT